MALETVQITVLTDDVVPVPVDDVVVRVYDATGTNLLTFGTTGGVTPGVVEFTLDGDVAPTAYQLRFYLVGGSILSPQRIEVYSPAVPANTFEVAATIPVRPVATDPSLCRVSGSVVGPNGAALRGVYVQFIHCASPMLMGQRMILGERVSHRTDAQGYLLLDLVRTGKYLAIVEGFQDVPRQVEVPDASSVDLGDLLFPYVSAITFDPPGPWTIAEGSEIYVVPTVTLSSGIVVEGPQIEELDYTFSVDGVASIASTDSTLTVRGNAAGSTNLRVQQRDTSIKRFPDPGVSGGTVGITVS